MKKDLPAIQKALCYEEYGDPSRVLTLVERSVPEPGMGEVLVEMQASPIHPSDMGLIQGSYGRLRTLPSVAGREGVGTVVQVGEGVDAKVLGRPVARGKPAEALSKVQNETDND